MTTEPAAEPHTPFAVVHQEHTPEPDHNGRMTGMWTIHFETPSGVRSFIKIPEDRYTANNVFEAIHERVKEIEKVHHLGHEEHH